MSLVGLNLTALYNAADLAVTGPNATFVLGPDKLEAAIAKAAAQLIWIGKTCALLTSPCSYSFGT